MLLLGGAMTAAPSLRAQQRPMPVVGFLGATSPGPSASNLAAFRQGLGETGYIEGQNLVIEYRWAEGRYDRLPALAVDLIGRKVDVIASGGTPSTLAARNATATIPIVFMAGGDPVELGLVASFARPGGNLTGFTIVSAELMPKRLELLSELVPEAKVMALLVKPNTSTTERVIRDMHEAGRVKGVQLHILNAQVEGELETGFASLVQLHAGALLVSTDSFFFNRRDQLVALTSSYAIPAIYEWRGFVASGGLISYGTSLTAVFRQVGAYVGQILKGAKPADLPVQQPTLFSSWLSTSIPPGRSD
jgi:ABC-type uncharacterized transport system substrate-binding protein